MIIILPIVFVSMWYLLYKKEKDLIRGLAEAQILYHICLLVITNLFSIGNVLNRMTVSASWLFVLFALIFWGTAKGLIFADKQIGADYRKRIRGQIRCRLEEVKERYWNCLGILEKLMLVMMAVLFCVLFVGALFTVPYNYDSMTYHLGRVGHWIDNGSVNHYVTNIDRQVYSPVMSEYELLHMYLLSGNDSFLNMLQYFSMIFTGMILYRITRKLGTGRAFSMFAALLFYTMPLTISQSITTQNDLLAAMWFAIFLYYLVDFIKLPSLTFDGGQKKKLFLIGASVAFAFLTKTSICASMLFFMPWLLIVCIRRRDKIIRLLQSA